ncbi:MAG TPA: hypothetical protein VGL09_21855 [Methylomirabilota bacterium]|jgi:hypothetical protein
MRVVIAAVATGAALMYLLDPDRGGRRRALVRDQAVRMARRTGNAFDATSRDLTNRARGVVADLQARFRDTPVGDETLRARVRARVGAVVGYASAIDAEVVEGRVTLRGPVLAADVERVLRRVRAVRGVRDVLDRLHAYADAADVPALQGARRVPRGGEVFELMQDRWSPAARVFTAAGSVTLAVWGLRRRDAVGLAAAAVGAAIVARAVSNVPMMRLAEAAERAARELSAP